MEDGTYRSRFVTDPMVGIPAEVAWQLLEQSLADELAIVLSPSFEALAGKG